MWSSDIYKILNRNIVQKSSKYLNHISSEYLDCEHVYRISLIWYLSVLDNFLCHPHCLPNLVHNLITRTIKQFINHQLWSGVWPYSRFGNFVPIFSTNEIWTFAAATFSPPLQFVWYELVVNASDEETQETAWWSTHGINLKQGENSLPAKPSELETDCGGKMIKPSEGLSGN